MLTQFAYNKPFYVPIMVDRLVISSIPVPSLAKAAKSLKNTIFVYGMPPYRKIWVAEGLVRNEVSIYIQYTRYCCLYLRVEKIIVLDYKPVMGIKNTQNKRRGLKTRTMVFSRQTNAALPKKTRNFHPLSGHALQKTKKNMYIYVLWLL